MPGPEPAQLRRAVGVPATGQPAAAHGDPYVLDIVRLPNSGDTAGFGWRLRAGNGRLLGRSATAAEHPEQAQAAFAALLTRPLSPALISCSHAAAGRGWEWWLRSEAGLRVARSGREYERNAHCRRGSLHFLTALARFAGTGPQGSIPPDASNFDRHSEGLDDLTGDLTAGPDERGAKEIRPLAGFLDSPMAVGEVGFVTDHSRVRTDRTRAVNAIEGAPAMPRISLGLTLAATAAVTLGLAAGPALADPPAGTVPAHTSIVGVGSDTTMNVVNQLSVDYNKTAAANKLYSWDAIGSATISTKTGCAAITRPNGSGAGIAALKANARPSGDAADYCVDFARSSRGPQTGDGATTHLAFVAYAKDAVAWSANTTTNATTSLTTLQLRAIYSCNAALLGTGKTGRVTWNEVGGTSTANVVPVIPQSSSGTRSFFLSKIGVTTLGSCVVPTNNTVEENEGTNAIFANADKANEIFPYSVAVYLAQSVHNHGAGTQGLLKLHSVNSVAPTTGTGTATKINAAFPYIRSVYNVVRDNGTATHVPTYLQPIFGAGGNNGYICTNATAQADLASFGFLPSGSNCGAVTLSTS